MKELRIFITDGRRWNAIRRMLAVFLVCVVPTGLGILVDSRPMQWVGFFMTVLVVIGIAIGERRYRTTPAEARRVLDALDADVNVELEIKEKQK